MARRHWLDPLARQLLIASGQLPAPAPDAERRRPGPAFAPLVRRLATPPASPSGRPASGASDRQAADAVRAEAHEEAVERDLLALKLAQNPALPLRDASEVRHAAALGWRLDVNRATASDWLRLPGCTAGQADLLARLIAGGVQLSGPDDLARLLGLDATTLAGWRPLLEFRWYGEGPSPAAPAPVPVNQASASELQALPGLTSERLLRLQRERARAPFRDLAELRERLSLPPSLIESWIGRVSFAPGPAGPELPPASRSRPGGASR